VRDYASADFHDNTAYGSHNVRYLYITGAAINTGVAANALPDLLVLKVDYAELTFMNQLAYCEAY
jgi:hypothetical protein